MKYKPIILQVAEALEYHFPNNYEIASNYFIIKFEEVKITNERGKFHIIRDLYIKQKIEIKNEILYIKGSPMGFRGKLSYNEIIADYAHSHLDKIRDNFDYFCTGDSEISGILVKAGTEGIKDINAFESYLMTLTNLASWESLNGVPHKHIEGIKESFDVKPDISSSDREKLILNLDIDKCRLVNNRILENKYFKDVITDAEVMEFQQKYTEDSMAAPITILGLDNMTSRKLAVEKWASQGKERNILIDGRLEAEQGIIYTLRSDKDIKQWMEEYFPDDENDIKTNCTMQQTSYNAAIMGGYITTLFNNHIANQIAKESIREVPFKIEYLLPTITVDQTEIVNVKVEKV